MYIFNRACLSDSLLYYTTSPSEYECFFVNFLAKFILCIPLYNVASRPILPDRKNSNKKSPPSGISMSAGYEFRDYFKYGVLLDLLCYAVIAVSVPLTMGLTV